MCRSGSVLVLSWSASVWASSRAARSRRSAARQGLQGVFTRIVLWHGGISSIGFAVASLGGASRPYFVKDFGGISQVHVFGAVRAVKCEFGR